MATRSQSTDVQRFVKSHALKGLDLKTVVNGNDSLPNMYHRQDRFIGQVLDAAIVLHVYEQIVNENAAPRGLAQFFHLKKGDLEKLNFDTKRPQQVMDALLSMQAKGELISHRNLVNQDKWKRYQSEFTRYRDKLVDWKEEVASVVANGEGAISPKPKPPEDPRVSHVNDLIGQTMVIVNPGPKDPDVIQDKVERKNMLAKQDAALGDIRDVNRVGVFPRRASYAKDFLEIMQAIAPKDPQKHQSMLISERPEVKANGFFNQKAYVVLNRGVGQEEGDLGGRGFIAEVRILPAKMDVADKLTSCTKEVVRKLQKPTELGSAASKATREDVVRRRVDLKMLYDRKKRDFERVNEANGTHYDFPQWPRNDNQENAYRKLRTDFENLEMQIHTDAILGENRTWQEEFLHTALVQKMAGEDDKFQKRVERFDGQDLLEKAVLPDRVMARVAQESRLDLESLKQRAQTSYSKHSVVPIR